MKRLIPLFIIITFAIQVNVQCTNHDEILNDYEQLGKYLYHKDDLDVLRKIIKNSCEVSSGDDMYKYSDCSIDSVYDENGDGYINPLEVGTTFWGENRRLTILYAPGMGISGNLPDEISDLASLEKLDLRNNSLSGEIPSSIVSLKNLRELWLDDNSLTGGINENLKLLESLNILSLQNNSLFSMSSDLCTFIDSLSYFSVRGNQICDSAYYVPCLYKYLEGNQNCQ